MGPPRRGHPDDAPGDGDGNATGDTDGCDGFTVLVPITEKFAFDDATGCLEGIIQLRAERAGEGRGRAYTITAQVADEQGNVGQAACGVVVPHSKGKK